MTRNITIQLAIITLKIRRRTDGINSGTPSALARLSCVVVHPPLGVCRFTYKEILYDFYKRKICFACDGRFGATGQRRLHPAGRDCFQTGDIREILRDYLKDSGKRETVKRPSRQRRRLQADPLPLGIYGLGDLNPDRRNPCRGGLPCSQCRTLPMWKGFDKMVYEYFSHITLEDLARGSATF